MLLSVYVISDLHLGGAPQSQTTPAFQMCSAQGQERLEHFLKHLTQEAAKRAIHLVINGDIVDFLAETPFAAFTQDDRQATEKLSTILSNHRGVFDQLARFVASGARLTLLLGNHDIELSLPGPRRLLLQRLGVGHVEFIYDNEALTFGRALLIEHGNSYDEWNAVDYAQLRKLRAELTRGRPQQSLEFKPMPGSQLVAGLMNRIKKDHPHVDLLKPEIHMAMSLLLAIDPQIIKEFDQFLDVQRLAEAREYQTQEGHFISASRAVSGSLGSLVSDEDLRLMLAGSPGEARSSLPGSSPLPSEGHLIAHATAAALPHPPDSPSVLGYLRAGFRILRALASRDREEPYLRQLLAALREFASVQRLTFDLGREEARYLRPATRAARMGKFAVVVYGHTHLVKDVPIYATNKPVAGEVPIARYLNSGTWADLMKVPDEFLRQSEESLPEFKKFVHSLSTGQLMDWRKLLPTFSRVDLCLPDDTGSAGFFFDCSVASCGVFAFSADHKELPVAEYLAAHVL